MPAASSFATLPLAAAPQVAAPDGSDLRVLLRLAGGSMVRFELPSGRVSHAVVHSTVEEIWYVLEGRGEMWRGQDGREEIVALEPGLCLTIPVGTRFQFRADPAHALAFVAVTLPPWPGDGEAIPAEGPWTAL